MRALSRTRGLVGDGRPPRLTRAAVRRHVVLSLGSFGAGLAVYQVAAPEIDLLRVQLGGGAQPLPLPPGTEAAMQWDFAFILGYSTAFGSASRLAGTLLRSGPAALLGRSMWPLAVVAGLADVTENILVLVAVSATEESATRHLLDLVKVAATVKFACWIPAALIGGTAVVQGIRTLAGTKPLA